MSGASRGAVLLAVGLFAFSAHAEDAALDPLLQAAAKKYQGWTKEKALVDAVKAQNDKKVTLADIQALDRTWVQGGNVTATVDALLANACAAKLKELVAQNPGVGESFVMDNQGALVCMTQRTSDYWQGDEPKWQKSFNDGKGAVFIDVPHYDSSAKAILVQISVPIMDGAKAVGAITVGLDAKQLKADAAKK